MARVQDPELTGRPLVGAIDQYVDDTDALTRPTTFRGIAAAVDDL